MADNSLRAGQPSAVPVPARRYQGRRAGVVTRVVANVVDLGVVIVIIAAIYAAISAATFLLNPSAFHWPARLTSAFPFIGIAILLPYLTLSWAITGRTYGNTLLGLRIVNYRGGRMRIAGAALRAIACTLFPIGLLWAAISTDNRSLQDIILRTSVIYDWTARPAIT